MTGNLPNLVKEKDTQVQEAQRVLLKLGQKRPTRRHIKLKWQGLKTRKILNVMREKQGVAYTGAPIRLASDYSTETFQARREWRQIFKVMKSKDLQLRLLYPARLSFKIEGEVRSFPDKKQLKEFVMTKPYCNKC